MKGPGFVLFMFVLVHMVHRPRTTVVIDDSIHNLLADSNKYYGENPDSARVLIFATSIIIQVASYAVIFIGLFGRTFRPLTGALLGTVSRQAACLMVELPVPKGIQWFKPYPSIPEMVFYDVQSDLYYSGHAGLVMTLIMELVYTKRTKMALVWLAALGWEVYVLLVLRVHYTVDMIDGALSVFVFMSFAYAIRQSVDDFIAAMASKLYLVLPLLRRVDAFMPARWVKVSTATVIVRLFLLMHVGYFWYYTQEIIGARRHVETPVDHGWEATKRVKDYFTSQLYDKQDVMTRTMMLWVSTIFLIISRSAPLDMFCGTQKLAFAMILRYATRVATPMRDTPVLEGFKMTEWWQQQVGPRIVDKAPLVMPYVLVAWAVLAVENAVRGRLLSAILFFGLCLLQASALMSFRVLHTIDVVNSFYCGMAASMALHTLHIRYGKTLEKIMT